MPKRQTHKDARKHHPRDDVVWENIDLDNYDEIELAPLERRRHAMRESILPLEIVYEEEQEQPVKYQFAIRHMLVAQACLAVLLGLMQVFAPSLLAGTLGISVLIMAILMAVYEPEEKRVQLLWWTFFAIYLIACIVAFTRA